MRLEAAGLEPFVLAEAQGIVVSAFDPGFPVMREVVEDRTNGDGSHDDTLFHGAKAVTITASIVREGEATLMSVKDRLTAFCQPSIRPFLHFDVDGIERRIRLRADQMSAPLTNPNVRQVQASWRAPDGIEETAALAVETISPSTALEEGRSYDLVFDRTYPPSAVIGAATVVNEGATAAWPVLRIYGPCSDPEATNLTLGDTVSFTGLDVAAGDYLEVDMQAHSAAINGESSRLSRLDFATSAWWPLVSGANEVRFRPSSFSGASEMQIRFRHAWL